VLMGTGLVEPRFIFVRAWEESVVEVTDPSASPGMTCVGVYAECV